MHGETVQRDRVFRRFEDADYFYRSRGVEELQRRISVATDGKDDVAAIKAYEELYTLLSAGRDLKWRQKFFYACLRPMSDVFVADKVLGCLYDFLGRVAFDLRLDDYRACYDRAVDAGDDSVMGREPVLKAYPEIILRWIACRLEKVGRDAEVRDRETLFGRIVCSRPDAAQLYLQLAKLLRTRYRREADVHYRTCIHLGCDEVVRDGEFLTAEYESDYVEWFNNLCGQRVEPSEAARRSLQPLWETNQRSNVFSKSHQVYAERLYRDGLRCEAVAEYVSCAEIGMAWAEPWLHMYSSDPVVYEGISDKLIEGWFKDCKDSTDRQRTLGRCFIHDRGREYRKDPNFFACIARCRLGDDDVLGGLQTCLQMDEAACGRSRDFMEQTALDEFALLRRDVREAVRKNVKLLVSKEMTSVEYDSLIVDELSLDSGALPSEDLKILREYVLKGSLEVSPFRTNTDKPLCSRYLLLDVMEKMFAGNGTGLGVDERTMKYLQRDFNRLADREFKDSVRQNNPMTTCKWLIYKLFEAQGSSERREGEAVLYRMVAKWQLGDNDLPIKLLASYWKSIGRAREYMLALRIFFDNDKELHKWIGTSDARKLFALAYESVSGAVCA